MEIKIYNEDCLITMERNFKCNCILTSPPYNMTNRKGGISDSGRYDVYKDWKTEEEYLNWTVNIFNKMNNILLPNGVILYNFGYSIENPSLPYELVSHIKNNTNFTLIDTIIWKKSNGLPFPANSRRLSRIWEYVFVFVRKNEINTFNCYKGISSISEKTNQIYYNVYYNFVEAKNNDEKCKLNQATFSSDLCNKLLSLYCPSNGIVYDPFIGTGTTAIACKQMGLSCIGSEISKEQCEWAENRINNT